MEKDPDIISIAEYYQKYSHLAIIDVRSPGEFTKGHIPGATNIPLFSDAERAMVGTAYVRQSKEIAMNIGLKIVKPKLEYFIEESEKVAPSGEVVVHCWRGGMRSQSFARHLSDNGFHSIRVIEGGYKSFRNYVLHFFEYPFKLTILGGYTGSGKTMILKYLQEQSLQVVDLEGVAHHRGSAFGGIEMGKQPTGEQFENNLFEEMRHLDQDSTIWMEDESHHIGSVFIPLGLFKQIEKSEVYFLDIKKEKRAEYLVQEYAGLDKEQLAFSIRKITKRLGYDRTKKALEYLENNNFYEVAITTLTYYDKYYLGGLSLRKSGSVHRLASDEVDTQKNARILLKAASYE